MKLILNYCQLNWRTFLRWSYFLVFVAHFFFFHSSHFFSILNYVRMYILHYMLLAIEVQKFKTHSVQNVHTHTLSLSPLMEPTIRKSFQSKYRALFWYSIQLYSFLCHPIRFFSQLCTILGCIEIDQIE